jgi:LPXTG-site transpeptidase (sortase) family protein
MRRRDTRGARGLALTDLLVAAALLGLVVLLAPHSQGDSAEFRPLSSPAKPVKLIIPSQKIRAAIRPIEVNSSNVLDPPSDVREVGWWRRSVRPGAHHGQTVLTGHTVHDGGGVMDRLGKLHVGRVVRVVTPKGTMAYRATKVLTLTKPQLAQRSRDLFGQTRPSNRLVLITCTGWTGSDYTSNVVVFAKPLGVPNTPARKKT